MILKKLRNKFTEVVKDMRTQITQHKNGDNQKRKRLSNQKCSQEEKQNHQNDTVQRQPKRKQITLQFTNLNFPFPTLPYSNSVFDFFQPANESPSISNN